MYFRGISEKAIQTQRLRISYLEAGSPVRQAMILLHGNYSSSHFWPENMRAMADKFWVLAPDLRGYGKTEPLPIDATRGVRDWSDDLKSFVQALGIKVPFHLVGWSLGGSVALQYTIDNPTDLATLTLICPGSPYGVTGTKGLEGTLCYPNAAGTGAGAGNPLLSQAILNGDRGADSPQSPLNMINSLYFKPPFRVPPEVEDIFVEAVLTTRIGEDFSPGDFELVKEWPGFAPGTRGVLNALSPKYHNLTGITEIEPKVPILWVRGSDDKVISDMSLADYAVLGKLGLVQGWPGEEVFPVVPMLQQIRYVLDQYQAKGGSYEEYVIPGTAHSPHIEKPDLFHAKVFSFIAQHSR